MKEIQGQRDSFASKVLNEVAAGVDEGGPKAENVVDGRGEP